MIKSDIQLKQDIEAELLWDPKVNASQIGVAVDKGAVSLLGCVDTYPEKWAAEDATKRVRGVRAVAEDLTVKLRADHRRNDPELALAIQSALTWNVYVPNTVTARVEQGSVTLEGLVTWNYQRDAAMQAVRHLSGVVKVHNAIKLSPLASLEEVKGKVEAALHRQAGEDAKSIHVELSAGKVTLTGHASSWRSIQDASNAAWSAPGVTQVIDQVSMSMAP